MSGTYSWAADKYCETRESVIEEAITRFRSPSAIRETYYSQVVGRYGVLSLSAVPDHPLLWAQYADEYRGFCLEFDPPGGAERLFGGAFRVVYTEDRPVVDVLATEDDDRDDELYTNGLLTKSKAWEHEQEYRVTDGHGPGLVSFPPAALSAVILGSKASQENKEKLVALLRERPQPVRLLQVAFEDESFALRFDPVRFKHIHDS